MKKLLVFLCIASCSSCFSQNIQLSSDAQISVITCGPFQGEVYSAFGHSAFRVYDPQQRIDAAFNYGVFDYNQPNFYLNFARGKNKYMLGVQDYPHFREVYIYYNRFIHEQQLNLTQSQKQKLFEYLEWNAKPENQYYFYDYFYDNCATKIRDVVVEVFGDDVSFDGSYITTNYTIRDLTDIYLNHQPWGDLGIDICLGLPMDKKASPYEYMFLPDFIESGFDHATIKTENVSVPIVKEKNLVYETRDEEPQGGLPHPQVVFSVLALLVLALSLWDLKRKKLSTWFDVILFGTTGIVGLLLIFLWLFTDHKAAANNFNVLWAFPTHLIAVAAFLKNPLWLRKYFLITASLQGLLLLTWWILPQQLNYALLPMVLAILARAYVQFRLRPMAG